MLRFNANHYDYDPLELDRGMFEEMWETIVIQRDQRMRKVVLKRRVRSKIIELYEMIVKLEKAKKILKNSINNFEIISKICETINVLRRGINHWKAFYSNYK